MPAGDELRYNYAGMAETSAQMRQNVTRMNAAWEQLKSVTNQTLATMDGQAAGQLRILTGQADQQCTVLTGLVGSHATTIDDTASTAQQVDTQFYNQLSNIKI